MAPEILGITVLICTHNRLDLLSRVIASLNAAERPDAAAVRLFVVANACNDGTHEFLASYAATAGTLPLDWIAEPTPGKSHALNRALPLLTDPIIAFVDDDHRVAPEYLAGVALAARTWPETGLFCGRILPDWDGTEPGWVHDTGKYRIYPLPVPRYDQGQTSKRVDLDGAIPGGGNLVARLAVTRTTGPFLTELGPTGHDLGGAEDLEWVRRSMRYGAVVRYVPEIVQYHFVDGERLTLPYLMRKGFQRSKSVMRFRRSASDVPLYMWRKVGGYAARSVLSLSAQSRRFYLVRLASSLGEMSGMREAEVKRRHRARLPRLPEQNRNSLLGLIGVLALVAATYFSDHRFDDAFLPTLTVALALAITLVAKSVIDFSQTGPRLRDEIVGRYRRYVPIAMARLGFTTLAIGLFTALPGSLIAVAAADALAARHEPILSGLASLLTLGLCTAYAGCSRLVHNPGLIISSWQYRSAPLHRLWTMLSAQGIKRFGEIAYSSLLLLTGLLVTFLALRGMAQQAGALVLVVLGYACILGYARTEPEGCVKRRRTTGMPNVLMIGSDTLRADRVGAIRNNQSLTPNIDALAARGTHFTACYVPCARTAPSLISMFTGTWPHTHGIRDNFVADEETKLEVAAIPETLRALGYRTAAISDWCGADLGKFSLGFDILDLPEDQWNLKYLIRQGPKDIRLFLSLFLHNRLGRHWLPELYYLGGVPQTTQMGQRGRQMLSRLAATNEPFLLNLFYSTTHPPFSSEYPFYVRHADPGYGGESKFAMARLTDPFDIIRRQGEPREEFDLDQILALYDGCVAQFDDEVGKTITHLATNGLLENTIVVLYSDHGMEFFEHGTWGQGNSAVGDFSARVPLVIADPRQTGGQRVDQVVRSIDLAPTLLDLLQAPSVKCDGTSLAPVMANPSVTLHLKAFNETGIWIAPTPGLPTDHLIYPDLLQLLDVPDDATGTLSIKAEYQTAVLTAKDRMMRDGRWKLVYQPLVHGKRLTLYDVVTDPGCTRDVSQSFPDEVGRLWVELQEWMKGDPVLRRDTRVMPEGELSEV